MFDVPLTFNDETHVTLFESVVVPETFNDEIHVVLLLIMVVPDIYNDVFNYLIWQLDIKCLIIE